jgi:membrane protease YdiL (CAAX protease family)
VNEQQQVSQGKEQPMGKVRARWITALTAIAAGFLAVVGVALLVNPGDGDYAGFVVWGVGSLLGAVALVTGTWGLWSGRIGRRVTSGLLVVGLAVVGLFWWMIVPAVLALVLLYVGVIRGGLRRELASSR